MTERDEYMPSLEEVCEDFAHVSGWIIDPKARAIHDARVAAFWRMIEAVRQEEREKAAQIADRLHGVGNDIIAARIREQGTSQADGTAQTRQEETDDERATGRR